MKISPYMLIGASSILAIIALGFYFYETSPMVTDTEPTVQVTAENNPEPSPKITDEEAANAEISAATLFGINLARVHPDGSAVIAGIAPPRSTVNLIENGRVIGVTVASENGEWVIIPDAILSEGTHLFSVEIIAPDGDKTVAPMALAIEVFAGEKETPLVALVPYTAAANQTAATILQLPKTLMSSASNEGALPPRLTIRSIQAISPSIMAISGTAQNDGATIANGAAIANGATIMFSINGADGAAITASLDDKSNYSVSLPIDENLDQFNIKGVLLDGDGNRLATAALRLSRSKFEQGLGGNDLIVIQKGDALWRIAYKTYGQGIRYLDIYRQNKSSINDPDLIYPDQIFVIPKEG